MSTQRNSMKVALAATLMGSLLLVACGGDDDNGVVTPTAVPTTAPTTAPTATATAIPTTVAATPTPTDVAATPTPTTVAATPTSAPGATTKTWGFDQAAFSTADTSLFTATFSATADNSVKALAADNVAVLAGTSEVTVDGIKFNASALGVIRYRPTGMSSNASGSDWLNTNGAFFSNNTTLIPAAGEALPTNVRAYFGVPVATGSVFTISMTYRQTSGTATAGKLALVCNTDGKVLAVADASTTAGAYDADKVLTYTAPAASHGCTVIRAIYGRETLSTGGVNIKQIVRTQ